MQVARVVGNVVATRKDPNLIGHRLLVLQQLTPAREQPIERQLVAAGVGEDVFFVRGREASFPFLPDQVPTDASIIGIVDHRSTDPMV